MITIHNFNEAYQQYKSGFIPLRLLQEQAQIMLSLTTHPPMTHAYKITNDRIDWLIQQPEATQDYLTMLGGHCCICECEADLKQIVGCDFAWAETHGGWPNVTDLPMSWDNCCYLQEAKDEPQWVTFLMCWNNAGGPTYYVPKKLWDIARVEKHIVLTESA